MDINISSQIVVQTAAQWAADNTVYSNKRILVTSDVYYGSTDQRKFKIADGTQTWANLDYMPISQTLAQVVANGDTLNGLLAQSNDTFSKLYVEDGDIDVYYNNGVKLARIVASALSLELTQTDLIKLSAPTINLPQATASRIVETDASKNLTYVAKNTAYNLNLGTTAGTVLEGNAISQVITNGVTDKAPSEDAVFDALALKSSFLSLKGLNFSPADATSYYFVDSEAPNTSAVLYRFYAPSNLIIKKAYVYFAVTTTLGTTETSSIYIRVDNTTDNLISNAVTLNVANSVVSNTALNLAVSAGSYFNIKWTTPTWATNPTNIQINAVLEIANG